MIYSFCLKTLKRSLPLYRRDIHGSEIPAVEGEQDSTDMQHSQFALLIEVEDTILEIVHLT